MKKRKLGILHLGISMKWEGRDIDWNKQKEF